MSRGLNDMWAEVTQGRCSRHCGGRGRSPRPGELGVAGVGAQGGGEVRELGGALKAARRLPRAERGFEPMTRWSRNQKYL